MERAGVLSSDFCLFVVLVSRDLSQRFDWGISAIERIGVITQRLLDYTRSSQFFFVQFSCLLILDFIALSDDSRSLMVCISWSTTSEFCSFFEGTLSKLIVTLGIRHHRRYYWFLCHLHRFDFHERFSAISIIASISSSWQIWQDQKRFVTAQIPHSRFEQVILLHLKHSLRVSKCSSSRHLMQ